MEICVICNPEREFKNKAGLTGHLRMIHEINSLEEYEDIKRDLENKEVTDIEDANTFEEINSSIKTSQVLNEYDSQVEETTPELADEDYLEDDELICSGGSVQDTSDDIDTIEEVVEDTETPWWKTAIEVVVGITAIILLGEARKISRRW